MTFRERRVAEVARQKRRNKKDLLLIAGQVICLIAFAACMVGFVNFAAGGW
jgi:hypothetical protein